MHSRGPQDGTLTPVHAWPWASGRHAHTSPHAAVALRVARSHYSMRGHGRFITTSAESSSGLQSRSVVSVPDKQMQGSDPTSPWRYLSVSKFGVSCLPCSFSSLVVSGKIISLHFVQHFSCCNRESDALYMFYCIEFLPFTFQVTLRKINTPALCLIPQMIPVQELNHLTKHRGDALEAVCPAVFSGFCGASSQQWERGFGWRGLLPLPHFCFSFRSPSEPSPPRLETQGQRRERLTRGGVGEE